MRRDGAQRRLLAAQTLDAPGAILVTAHREDAQAVSWVAADLMLSRCEVTLHATVFRALPYRLLGGEG